MQFGIFFVDLERENEYDVCDQELLRLRPKQFTPRQQMPGHCPVTPSQVRGPRRQLHLGGASCNNGTLSSSCPWLKPRDLSHLISDTTSLAAVRFLTPRITWAPRPATECMDETVSINRTKDTCRSGQRQFEQDVFLFRSYLQGPQQSPSRYHSWPQ